MDKNPQGDLEDQKPRVGPKKLDESCPEPSRKEDLRHFCARNLQEVREHGTMASTHLALY